MNLKNERMMTEVKLNRLGGCWAWRRADPGGGLGLAGSDPGRGFEPGVGESLQRLIICMDWIYFELQYSLWFCDK